MSDDRANPQPEAGAPRLCGRCGAALQAAMHLPQRVGQPAYDIFRCVACGFIDWAAQGPQPRTDRDFQR